MLIELKDTLNLLTEETNRLDITKDNISSRNMFTTHPQGIIIQDSYNNPFFPITPKPRLDTSNLDLQEVYRRFRELYGQQDILFLPWHYCVELVDNRYYVFNTRPINIKFPITNNDIDLNLLKDDISIQFFNDNIIDISECLHVCVIGDSNLDVYTMNTYKLIRDICIQPIVRYFKLPGAMLQRIFSFNIGSRFKTNLVTKFS